MQHTQIWRALDALATRRGLTPSGLARAAGLDPTTFNKSKREMADGRPRWPSTESLALALDAVDATFDDFAALLAGGAGAGRAIPVVGMARAGKNGFFDDQAFPVGAEETVRFPGLSEDPVYALEISGDSMEPLFREGDVVIVQPHAAVRRGDRVVVKTREGEVTAKILGRRNEQSIELISINPTYPVRLMPAQDVEWTARIVWASQ
jgi:phage repressor protein C with HTH and peptisase S24 domain